MGTGWSSHHGADHIIENAGVVSLAHASCLIPTVVITIRSVVRHAQGLASSDGWAMVSRT
jgi:hypothetical protein